MKGSKHSIIKKGISLVLAFGLIVLPTSQPLMGAELTDPPQTEPIAQVEIESKTLAENTTATIAVTVNNVPEPGLAGYQMEVEFDPNFIEITEVTKSGALSFFEHNIDPDGLVMINAAQANGISGNFKLFDLQINAKQVTGLESTEIQIFDLQLIDEDLKDIPYTVTPGAIQIIEQSVYDRQQAIENAIAAIEGLPHLEELTLLDKPIVLTARAAVEDALSKNATEADITNIATLVAAEEKIKDLEAQQSQEDAIQEAITAISALPLENELTLDNEPEVTNARTLVTLALGKGAEEADITNLLILEKAETKISALKQAEQEKDQAIEAAIAAINNLPAIESLTVENKDQVLAARSSVETALAKGADVEKDITNLSKLTAAENKIADIEAMLEAIEQAIEAIVALPTENELALMHKAQVIAARQAVISAKEKGAVDSQITNLPKLESAEAKIAALEQAVKDKEEAIAAAINAIDDLPGLDNLALTDKDKVSEARTAVEAAQAKGANINQDITNLAKLEATEAKIIELEKRQAAVEEAKSAIETLPINDELKAGDIPQVSQAREKVEAALLLGATNSDITNLQKLLDSEAKIQQYSQGITISTTTLPEGTEKSPYEAQLEATNAMTPLTWSAEGLPEGLTIEPSTGIISGTLDTAFKGSITVSVKDSWDPEKTASKTFNLVIKPTPLTITAPETLPEGVAGAAYPEIALEALGGYGQYTWSQTGLPSGLTLDPATGKLSGIPTRAGEFQAVVRVTDSWDSPNTNKKEITLSFKVLEALKFIHKTSFPAGTVGKEYSTKLSDVLEAKGGKGEYTWTVTGLPEGLTLDPTTLTISGTPTMAGAPKVTVQVKDSYNPSNTLSAEYKLVIDHAAPKLEVISNLTTNTPEAGAAAALWSLGNPLPASTLNAYPGDKLKLTGAYLPDNVRGVLFGQDNRVILLENDPTEDGVVLQLPQNLAKGQYVLTVVIPDGPYADKAVTVNIASASWYLSNFLRPTGEQLPTNITSDLTLPPTLEGYTDLNIKWTSSNTAFLANDGKVNRPTYKQGDQSVKLTAEVTWKGFTQKYTYSLKIKALDRSDQDIVDLAKENLSAYMPSQDALNTIVNESVTLPIAINTPTIPGVTIEWSVSGDWATKVSISNESGVVSVTRPSTEEGNKEVTFTAKVKKGSATSSEVNFQGIVLAETKSVETLGDDLTNLQEDIEDESNDINQVVNTALNNLNNMLNSVLDQSNNRNAIGTMLQNQFAEMIKNLLGRLSNSTPINQQARMSMFSLAAIETASLEEASDQAKIIDNAVKTSTNFIFRADYGNAQEDLTDGVSVLKKLLESIETDHHFSSLATSENSTDKVIYASSLATFAQAFDKVSQLAEETYSITADAGAATGVSEKAASITSEVNELYTSLKAIGVAISVPANLQVEASDLVSLSTTELGSLAENELGVKALNSEGNAQIILPREILAAITASTGSENITIKQSPVANDQVQPLPEGASIVGAVYEVSLLEGAENGSEIPVQNFNDSPVVVSIPIQEPLTVEGAKKLLSEEKLVVKYFDTTKNQWENVEQQNLTIDEKNQRINFTTPHLTQFAVTTLSSDTNISKLEAVIGDQNPVDLLPVPFSIVTSKNGDVSIVVKPTDSNASVSASVKEEAEDEKALTPNKQPAGEFVIGYTPALGTNAVTIRVTAEDGTTEDYTGNILGVEALTLDTSDLPTSVTAGDRIDATLSASGGSGVYSWSSLNLPVELTLNNGSLMGTLSTPGNYSFTILVSDNGTPKQTATKLVSIAVQLPGAPNVQADDEDNVIEGIDATMEYRLDSNPTYTAYDSNNPPDLSGDHTLYVRRAANPTTGAPASPDAELTFTTNVTTPPPPDGDDDNPGGNGNGPGGGAPLPPVTPGPVNGEWTIQPTAQEQAAASASQAIAPAQGGIIQTQDGTAIKIPQGALSGAQNITFKVAIGSIGSVPKDTTVKMFDPVKTQREFTASVTEFKQPVQIQISYKDVDLDGIDPNKLALFWWNPEVKEWVKVGGVVDLTNKTVTASVYHFSTYAIMADTGAPARLSGLDRYQTAIAVAEEGWSGGADTVILVNANAYADALAGTPLAYKLNAPILLTDKNTLTSSTAAEIKKLKAKNIMILGGTGVISEGIETQLKAAGYTVTRYGGADRFDTARQIASALGTTGKAVIASGNDANSVDALAISSWAAFNGVPVLFTWANELPDATKKALSDQKVTSTLIAGGPGVVSEAILVQVKGKRYAGSNRYETAQAIAEELNLNPAQVYIATGLNSIDALVAGNLAAKTNAPLLFVNQQLPSSTKDYLEINKGRIGDLTVIGGTGVVSTSVEQSLRSLVP